MELHLKIISGNGHLPQSDAVVFGVDGGTFGRNKDCDWELPDPNREVSGTHGRIVNENGEFYLQDTSTNGIFLKEHSSLDNTSNQAQCLIGKEGRVKLNGVTVFEVGPYLIQVTINEMLAEVGTSTHEQQLEAIVSENSHSEFNSPAFDPLIALVDSGGAHEGSSTLDGGYVDGDYVDGDCADKNGFSGLGQVLERAEVVKEPITEDREGQQSNVAQAQKATIPENWDVSRVIDISQIENNTQRKKVDIDKVSTCEKESGLNTTNPSGEELLGTLSESSQTNGEITNVPRREKKTPKQSIEDVTLEKISQKNELEHASKSAQQDPDCVSSVDRFDIVMKKLGIDTERLSALQKDELASSFSTVVRESLQAIIDLLMARSECKNRFRAEQTILQSRENNPLKFCPSVDTALRLFFNENSAEFMGISESLREATNDIHKHQLAMLGAMNQAFKDFLGRINPENFIDKDEGGFARSIAYSFNKQSKAWKNYEKFHDIHCA